MPIIQLKKVGYRLFRQWCSPIVPSARSLNIETDEVVITTESIGQTTTSTYELTNFIAGRGFTLAAGPGRTIPNHGIDAAGLKLNFIIIIPMHSIQK
jgi:hypothetical protein